MRLAGSELGVAKPTSRITHESHYMFSLILLTANKSAKTAISKVFDMFVLYQPGPRTLWVSVLPRTHVMPTITCEVRGSGGGKEEGRREGGMGREEGRREGRREEGKEEKTSRNFMNSLESNGAPKSP